MGKTNRIPEFTGPRFTTVLLIVHARTLQIYIYTVGYLCISFVTTRYFKLGS
jgi:hypothetical protein